MADIENYEQAKAWLAKGRNQRKGRKLRSYMMRMDSSGTIIMSSMYCLSDGIAELTPDNILTFTMGSEGARTRPSESRLY